jgi:hypothetical protein
VVTTTFAYNPFLGASIMANPSDALYSCLLKDLSPHLGSEIHNFLRKEKVGIRSELGLLRNAAVSLANAFYAKYVGDANGDGEAAALQKFKMMNSHCERYKIPAEMQSWDEELLGEFKTLLYKVFYPSGDTTYEYSEILSRGKNGPGSSLGTNGTDNYTKLFSSKGTTTSEFLAKHLKCFFRDDHRWSSALNLREATFGPPRIVEGNRLSFVPKNRDIMRTICTEPSTNMFYQLGLGSIFEDRLNAFTGIKLATQPEKNRTLAYLGSKDDSFATIDLASASDTISLSLLKEVLPLELFMVLLKLRSKTTTFKGESLELHMVSTMGNGFTFPLQTILFTCAVLAVYKYYDIPIRHPSGSSLGNYGVFGDDIVVEKEAFRPLCKFLHFLGFFVNESKSFSEGPFRESCGEDYFSGVNIRGVYCKTLDSPQDYAVLVNRLNDFTSRTGIYLSETIKHLLSKVRFQPVPLSENDDSGIKVPLSMVKDRKIDKHVQSIRYHRWVARSCFLRINCVEGKILVPRGFKGRIFNPEGLVLEFLRSGLREFMISVRHDHVVYSRRTGISPNWDYLPPASGLRYQLSGRAMPLSEAIEANHVWLAPLEA